MTVCLPFLNGEGSWNSGDLVITGEFLGHASVQAAQVYSHASRYEPLNAANRMQWRHKENRTHSTIKYLT